MFPISRVVVGESEDRGVVANLVFLRIGRALARTPATINPRLRVYSGKSFVDR
jgi:hypothetical protein